MNCFIDPIFSLVSEWYNLEAISSHITVTGSVVPCYSPCSARFQVICNDGTAPRPGRRASPFRASWKPLSGQTVFANLLHTPWTWYTGHFAWDCNNKAVINPNFRWNNWEELNGDRLYLATGVHLQVACGSHICFWIVARSNGIQQFYDALAISGYATPYTSYDRAIKQWCGNG